MPVFHGHFLWHELMTTDPVAAKKFYSEVIGWTLTPGGIPDLDYDMWTASSGPVGGVMELPKEAQAMGANTHWIPYVGATDIRASFDAATGLGARTYVPVTDIPGVGWFCVLADPQGAMFAMYQPSTPADARTAAEPGEFSWHELAVDDARAALKFYGELFGWAEVEAYDMGPMGMYHLYGRDGHTFGGMFNRPPQMPASSWLCYVRVDSADDTATKVKNAGGTVINGPMEVPGGDRIAQCLDPQGGAFALHSLP